MGVCGSKNTVVDEDKQKDKFGKVVVIDEDQFVPDMIPQNYKLLKEEYTISDSVLGSGAYGEVRLATHKNTQEQRAVKIIIKENCTDNEYRKILKEVSIMKHIDHPNIVKIYEFFENQKYIFIIMELMSKGELFDMIQERNHFSEKKAAELMSDILSAVNYLHKKGIVHRDLKPENILFTQNGILKVVDFGTSKFYTQKKMKKTHGTPYYIAPEVIKENYNEKCDVWSCGVIMYILLSGVPPFNGSDDDEIMEKVQQGKFSFKKAIFSKVSDAAKNLIKRMLTKDVNKRITAEEALQDPWFELAQGMTSDLDQEALKNLKKFNIKNKMQQAVYLFLVNHIVSQSDREQLITTFKQLDANNDGVISKEELEKGFEKNNIQFSQIEIDNLFKALDGNKNNTIDYMEFVAAAIDREQLLTDQKIKQCFRLFDKDNSKTIDIQELKQVFQGDQKVNDQVWKDLMMQIQEEPGQEHITYEQFRKLLIALVK